MPSGWRVLDVHTHARLETIDITDAVAAEVRDGADGAVCLFTPHSTSALILNEHEEGLLRDVEAWLERAVPHEGTYAHNAVDDNADAHLRAIVLGSSLVVPVERGRLALGRWQRIFFVELDGPRARQVRMRLLE